MGVQKGDPVVGPDTQNQRVSLTQDPLPVSEPRVTSGTRSDVTRGQVGHV